MLPIWRNIFDPRPVLDTAPEDIKTLNKDYQNIAVVARSAAIAGYGLFVHNQEIYALKEDGTYETTGRKTSDLDVPDLFVLLTPDRTQCAMIAPGTPLILTSPMQAHAQAQATGSIPELFFVAWPELTKAAREKTQIITPDSPRLIVPGR